MRHCLILLTLLAVANGCSEEQPRSAPEPDAGTPVESTDAGAVVGGLAPREFTLAPQADAYVVRSNPAANYGSALMLEVDADATGTTRQALLRFALPEGTVLQARLRLWVVNASASSPQVRRVSDASWGEMTTTWSNQPSADPEALADLGRTSPGTWVEADVTSAIAGPTVAFLLAPVSEDGFDCASREDPSHAPRLVVTVRPPPDTTAPVLSALEVADVKATSATLTWTTDELSDTEVELGTSSALGGMSALDERRSLTHRLVLEGLNPSTTYHFQARSRDASGNVGASEILQLATPSTGAWKWIAYGDTRTNDADHRKVLRAVKAKTPDYRFLINVGDVVERPERTLWETWQLACEEELGGLGQDQTPPAYMSAAGNHEQLTTAGGLALWKEYLPGQAALYGNDGRYFSFDYENARFVVLDNNLSSAATAPQTQLLMEALTKDPKTWTFFVWHKPIFDFGPKAYESGLHADWGVPIYQHGGDLIFTGHAHYYVRSKKLALDGQMNPPLDPAAGVAQVVTGNGGVSLVPVDENADGNGYLVDYSFDQGQAAFHGYTELMVDGSTLTLRHVRTDGKVMDSTTYTANPKK